MIKKLKGWRTVIFNAVAAVPAGIDILVQLVQVAQSSTEIQALIPTAWMPGYLLLVGLINIYLRTQTAAPVGKSEEDVADIAKGALDGVLSAGKTAVLDAAQEAALKGLIAGELRKKKVFAK